MILGLTIAAAIGYILAAFLAYGHGREWWGASKARRQRDAAIKERDAALAEHEQCYQGAMELSDKVASLESERLAALEKIGQQCTTIESYKALQETSNHRIDELQREISDYRMACELKDERLERLTKEIEEWKAASEANRSDLELLRLETINTNGVVKQAAALLATVQ